jgi:hypothetical protein
MEQKNFDLKAKVQFITAGKLKKKRKEENSTLLSPWFYHDWFPLFSPLTTFFH